jgi:hypothetical protein
MIVETPNKDFRLRVTIVNPLDMSSVKIEELYPSGIVRPSNLSPQHLLYHMILGWKQIAE